MGALYAELPPLIPKRSSKPICSVEGFFDCMKVHQAGIRSVVGLMGSVLYEPQRHALRARFRHVILLLDGDATGRKASTVVGQKLRPHCHVRMVSLPDAVQPDQLPAEDIRSVLQASANDD